MFIHFSMLSSSRTGRPFRRFLLYQLPAILYAVAIIAVSSLPDLQTPDVKLIAFDKVIHFLEYAVFAVLAFRSFSDLTRNARSRRAFLFSALFLSLFAAFDESYQHWIPGRTSDIYDVLADLMGALLVLTVLEVRRKRAARSSSESWS